MSTTQADWEALAADTLGLDVDTVTARRIISVGTPCLLEQACKDRTCYVQLWYNGSDTYEVRWCRPAGVDETCPQPQYGSRVFSLAGLEACAPGWFGTLECKAEWNIECAVDQFYTLVTELGL